MTAKTGIEAVLRETILKAPEAVLEDRDLMRALVAANDRAMGPNVVDMRGLAMERLEGRLGRLEETHRQVLSAAHDALAGMHAVHRATLMLLDARSFEEFLERLAGDAAAILRIDAVRIVLESRSETVPAGLPEIVSLAEPGFVAAYGGGRPRPVALRELRPDEAILFAGELTASEATIMLDLGPGRLPAMLVLGAEDPAQFRPGQGIDLLAFLGGVVERSLRRWLA